MRLKESVTQCKLQIEFKLYLFPNLLLVPPDISDVRGHEERGHGAHGSDHPGRDEHARVTDSVVQDVHLIIDSVDMVDIVYNIYLGHDDQGAVEHEGAGEHQPEVDGEINWTECLGDGPGHHLNRAHIVCGI